MSATPPRFSILKEGRKYGEVDWDGRDGSWRVLHEAQVVEIGRQRHAADREDLFRFHLKVLDASVAAGRAAVFGVFEYSIGS